MKRKFLILTLMLLSTFMLALMPVQAAPKEKQEFVLYYEGLMTVDFDPQGLSHAGPKKSAGQDYPIQKTYHGKGIIHTILFSSLTINDGLIPHDSFSSVEEFEFNWKTMMAITKTKETIVFSGGTIELRLVEKLNYNTMSFEGTFVGHGTGDYKGVKIVGTSNGQMKFVEVDGEWVPEMYEVMSGIFIPVLAITRQGTVMGW